MKQYLELVQRTLTNGERHENRTGIDTIRTEGDMLRFDLREGFPAITTKKLAFKSVVGELCAFLRASRSAADFRKLGCKVWDQNANENKQWLDNPYRAGEDDLGPVYGVQWREWPGVKFFKESPSPEAVAKMQADGWVYQGLVGETGTAEIADGTEYDFKGLLWTKEIDQLGDCVRTIIKNPDSRRILFHGWNPAVLDQVALPACHLLYQFLPNKNTKELSMTLYIRSNDLGLGNPFNTAEAAALLELVARLTGYTAKILTIFISDCHIYENHLDMLNIQMTREPYPLPKLVINERVPSYNPEDNAKFMNQNGDAQIEHIIEWLRLVEPEDFVLEGYQHHPAISAPMAV